MKRIIFILLSIILTIGPAASAQTANPDKPLKGKWDFRVTKIWAIEDAGDDVIGEVQNIRAAKDGRIYIADSKNCKIYIFSKEGKFISSFGSRGEGPGEIKHYSSGDQLFVLDNTIAFVERGRIQYFSLDGTFIKTIIIPIQLKPRTFVSEDVFVSAPPMIEDPRNKKAPIKLYNVKDRSEKIISEFQPFDKASDTRQNGGRQMTIGIIIGNITPLMFVKYRNGKIYYGMSNSYKITAADLKGKKFTFSVEDRKQKNVSRAYKKELAQGLGDIPGDMLKNILDNLPEKASFFQGIEIDKNGRIYVFVSDPDNRNLQAIDIFSAGGKYLYSAEIKVKEGSSIQNIYLRDNLLAAAVENEEANLEVAKYSIELPPL